MVENGQPKNFDIWEDEDFLQELKSRLEDIENNFEEGLTWEEVKVKAQSY